MAEGPTSTPYNWGGIWANNVLWYFITGAVIAVIILIIFFLLKTQ